MFRFAWGLSVSMALSVGVNGFAGDGTTPEKRPEVIPFCAGALDLEILSTVYGEVVEELVHLALVAAGKLGDEDAMEIFTTSVAPYEEKVAALIRNSVKVPPYASAAHDGEQREVNFERLRTVAASRHLADKETVFSWMGILDDVIAHLTTDSEYRNETLLRGVTLYQLGVWVREQRKAGGK